MSDTIAPPKPLNENVNSGDPIRADDWKNVVAGVKHLYEFLQKPAVKTEGDAWVEVVSGGNPVTEAIVTVASKAAGGPVRSGIYAGSAYKKYLVAALPAGTYRVTVEAAGFAAPQGQDLVYDPANAATPPSFALVKQTVTATVPMLFGKELAQAIAAVTAAGFNVGEVIDSHGNDINPNKLTGAAGTLAVLGQVPAGGSVLARLTTVNLHVAAPLEVVQQVQVPDVRGLTIDQARAKLAAVGLDVTLKTT